MRRLFVVLAATLAVAGCVTEADRAKWDAAMQDWRGERSEMRSSGSRNGWDGGQLPKPTMSAAD